MKNKLLNGFFKKFQSYSFLIILALIIVAFFALAQLTNRNHNKPNEEVPTNNNENPNGNNNQPVVKLEDEVFKVPLAADKNFVKVRDFYSANLTEEEQLKAIVYYENTYFANAGVNYSIDKETKFDVQASLSGTVTKVSNDALLGYVVEVEHLYGLKSVYYSLSTVNVAIGDKVKQNQVLGKAGESNLDKESGVHVHFEVLKGAVKLNPNELIGKKVKEFNS